MLAVDEDELGGQNEEKGGYLGHERKNKFHKTERAKKTTRTLQLQF